MLIRRITTRDKEYQDMVRLRMKVLLQPVGIPESYINREKEQSDFLVAAFEEHELVGCCILSPISKKTMQLRQMAVRENYQGQGIGAAILSFAEQEARQLGYESLMMHARDTVLPFYEKCGYQVSGDQFFEVNVPHHRMEKIL